VITAETYLRAPVAAFWIAERRWPTIPEATWELRRLVPWWRASAVLRTALYQNDLGASVVRVRTAEPELMVLLPCLLEAMETCRRRL
jgi:hypothetical protein